MKVLLDTHVFLWYISGNPKLPTATRDVIRASDNEVFLSVVSIWEAVVKHGLGKLPLPEPAGAYLPAQRERHEIASLPLDEPSVARLGSLPALHRDPFDRMLVCQALEYGLVISTADEAVLQYPVTVL